MAKTFKLIFTADLKKLTRDEITIEGKIHLKILGEFSLDDIDEIAVRIVERFGNEFAEKIAQAKDQITPLS